MTAANTPAPKATASVARAVSSQSRARSLRARSSPRTCGHRITWNPTSAPTQSGVISKEASRPIWRRASAAAPGVDDRPQIATVTTIEIAAISTVAAVNRPKAAVCGRCGIQGWRRSR